MSLDQSNRGDKWSQGLHEVQYFDFLDFCNGQIAAPLPNKGIKSKGKFYILHFDMNKTILISSVLTTEQM